MGGLYSALSAELHTLWGVKRNSAKLHDSGNLRICEEGDLFWQRRRGWFALAQSGDTCCWLPTSHQMNPWALCKPLEDLGLGASAWRGESPACTRGVPSNLFLNRWAEFDGGWALRCCSQPSCRMAKQLGIALW